MNLTGSRGTTTPFFVATALMEATAGLALLITPAPVIELLVATSASDADVAIGRLAGAALLSLGIACWWARADVGSAASRALLIGMAVYNTAVIAVVLAGSFGSPSRLILMAVMLLHGAMALWCGSLLRYPPR